MNGKDLLKGLNYIDTKFVEEAESGTVQPRRTLRRPLLAAAMVALMLLLVGCAVVYVLKMQDLKIGEQTATREVFSTDCMEFMGYQEVEQQVLTFAGIRGSKNYQAAQEWFEFCREFDPDNAIKASVWENWPVYPDAYLAYDAYTDEMVTKLDEITDKYGLKLLGRPQSFRTAKTAMSALGLESVLTADSGATLDLLNLGCYEGGNFNLTGHLKLAEGEGMWEYPILTVLYYHDKAYFNTQGVVLDDTGDWQEWNYTTASGDDVLIMRSPSSWVAWIFCDREDATVSARVEAIREVYSGDGVVSTPMTDRQLEQVADAIDFGVKPAAIAPDADFAGAEAVGAVTQNGYTMEVTSALTDGYVAYVTVGITAPEGVELIDPDIPNYSLGAGNWADGFLEPVGEEGVHGSMQAGSEEDGDGLANTHNIAITMKPSRDDGAAPIREESVWNLYFENLMGSWWNSEKVCQEDELIAQGVWSFDIPFAGNDFREVELLTQPMTMQACIGWKPDGTDVYEEVTVTSFKLRSLSASIVSDTPHADFTDYNNPIVVVMEDGTEIPLSGTQPLTAESPIDLEKADHVRLSDGRKLMMP